MQIFLKRKFIFRCEDCGKMLETEFDTPEDIKDVEEDKVYFECECGGMCSLLRD